MRQQGGSTSIWETMLAIDRRWIFLTIAAVVAAPFIFGWTLPIGTVSPPTKKLYDFIEKLQPGTPVVISFDFGPASMPELQPMAEALARHILSRRLRLIGLSLYPEGAVLCQEAFSKSAQALGAKEGELWVNLGFKPGWSSVILGIGTDITQVFKTDHRQIPVAQIPAMKGVRNYNDIGLVIDLASSNTPGDWIRYAQTGFKQAVAAGITAVMATDYYPYLQSGQLVGLLNGLKGAAEYERLVRYKGLASLGMTSQSIAHIAIIVFVLLGNIGYFAARRGRRR
ncbi:MAG: hypothetical protein H5T86_09415 [Armatimonadetes bacterium]|nr:hypothetical protein [Armatimonadota bacterium]